MIEDLFIEDLTPLIKGLPLPNNVDARYKETKFDILVNKFDHEATTISLERIFEVSLHDQRSDFDLGRVFKKIFSMSIKPHFINKYVMFWKLIRMTLLNMHLIFFQFHLLKQINTRTDLHF